MIYNLQKININLRTIFIFIFLSTYHLKEIIYFTLKKLKTNKIEREKKILKFHLANYSNLNVSISRLECPGP